MSKYILILISVLFSSLCINGAPSIAEADSSYNMGNYQEAADLYETIAEEKGVSAALLFNMGNAYLQAGDYGKAMLSYLRARKLDPSNKEINSNLNYLKEKIDDANKAEQRGKRLKVTEDDKNFFQNIHTSVAENRASNTWAVWGVVFFLLFAGCAALYMFCNGELVRKFGFFGGFMLFGASIICVIFAYMGASASKVKDFAVITAYKTTLRVEPGQTVSSGKEGEVLTRGSKIRIVSEETDAEGNVTWFKVRLNSDYIGWVPASDLEII